MPQGPTPVITVTITDLAGNPAAAYMGFCFAMEINEETDHGYKKSITVQTGYKGLEEANTAPDDKRCAISGLRRGRLPRRRMALKLFAT